MGTTAFECPHCETPYAPGAGDTCLNCGGSLTTPGLPVDNDPDFDRVPVPWVEGISGVNLTDKDREMLKGMRIQGRKKTAVGLTDQGQPDAVCPKCQQPIAEGQMVNYPQGRETHVQCPPAGQQPSSGLRLPPGFKPRQPQAPQPAHKPGMIPPSVGRPQAASAKKADSRFIDDEWRELLTAQGWQAQMIEDDGEVEELWSHPDTDTEVTISVNEKQEPEWAFFVNDIFVEDGQDTTALLGLITGDSIEVEPKQQKPEPRNFAEGEVPDMDIADKHQLKSWGVIGRQRTVKGKSAGRAPRFSFAVPAEAAGKVAFHLAKAGMRDFEVVNFEEDQTSIFAFTNEPELHVAEEIVRAEFNDQIAGAKGMWRTWSPQAPDPSEMPERGAGDSREKFTASKKRAYDDPNEYLRGSKVTGPQLVQSRYNNALEVALDALDTLAEIGPSQDIKGCAQMSAADLRQFAQDAAAGKARTFASGEKVAGQWGERSYDGDQVHDVLDQFRESGNGFDNPIPQENLQELLSSLDGLSDDVYLGVVVFLVTHGSKVPSVVRQNAAMAVTELMGDEEYLAEWSNPKARLAEMEKELDILRGGKTADDKTALYLPDDLKYLNLPAAEPRGAQPKGMTDQEVAKLEKYRRKKLISWLDECGFLDAEGNGEMLAEYDAADFWKKDELYEEAREMIREERRFQSGYRRTMRGPRPYNRKAQPASGR
jgi:hypothetical protein